MAKQEPRTTLKQHVTNIIELMPAGVRVSFELRTSYDKVTGDYIVGQRGYYNGEEAMLLRFSVTKPRADTPVTTTASPDLSQAEGSQNVTNNPS